MGVPKFFRYISERYPCLIELLREYQIPEFDNLYLDMNGIIHICSHPDDNDPHFRITEERIFSDIFHYIEILFGMIKPQKLFFMAVDGVAPRAKMNQQRGRRFRTAKEAESMAQKAREKGEKLPESERFDSNCITPGTIFMEKLHEQLKYFIVNKISTDPLWQQCKIILSGHETPGEGEHKIMDYIRYLRAQPGHDPCTRHCLYGLDADLIMLGLCTHEPHFSLLREEVKFTKKGSQKRKNVPEQITFYLLHLSLLREYLEQEFISIKDQLSFAYNTESVIDDWVLMGFLVGNDFIPHLPNLHIANGALSLLYNAYMKVLPTFGGYINENGKLNLERFEAYMAALCCIEMEQFSEQYADLKYFESKTGRRPNDRERTSYKPRRLEEWQGENADDGLFDALEEQAVKPAKADLAALIKATEDMLVEPSEENLDKLSLDFEDNSEALESESESYGEDDTFNAEFELHKQDYYMNKLQYQQVTPEVMRAQAEGYVRAIQWNLNYYYNGVCSWSWYYEHHYAPFISDIKNFKDLRIDFDLGKPFNPYEQLLGVLPCASKKLLPACYHHLMEDPSSSIVDFYPREFYTDLNGKKHDWEAVVLIPFIDEERLLAAMKECNDQLTPEEVRRNAHRPMLVYEYTTKDLAEYAAPEYFPPVRNSHALRTEVANEQIRVPLDQLVKGAYPGAAFDVYYPGFPTTKHLQYKSYLHKGGVKLFEQPSKGETLYLQLVENPPPAPEKIAEELLGSVVFASWPHLVEALVVSISTKDYRYHYTNMHGEYNVEPNRGDLGHTWEIEKDDIVANYRDARGVIVGDTSVLVHCKLLSGRKYVFTAQGRINVEKQWANTTNAFPYQAIVSSLAQYNPTYKPYGNVDDVFTLGSTCFMLGLPHYGFQGTVCDSKESLKKGRVKLMLSVFAEPNFTPIYRLEQKLATSYMPVHHAFVGAEVSKRLFSRITGVILVCIGGKREGLSDDAHRHNIGLNLKFNKRNEEIPGYTRKENSTWLYSQKAIDLVRNYKLKYSNLFTFLESSRNCDDYCDSEIFPEDNGSGETVKEIVHWIKSQEYYSIEKQQCGSNRIEPEIVGKLEQVIDDHLARNVAATRVTMQVKPFLLYKPGLLIGNLSPDPKATFRLYDRVVNVRESYTVPLGHVGTIIAIHKAPSGKPEEFMYEVLFDRPFPGGMTLNCSPLRGYKMAGLALINRTHGARELEMKTGKPGHLYQKIGYSPCPYNSSSRNLYNLNPNSAFAAWNNPACSLQRNYDASDYSVNNPSRAPRAKNNAPGLRMTKKQKRPFDFMPFQKEAMNCDFNTESSGVSKSPEQASTPATTLTQQQPAAPSTATIGVSLTANDLFAHVSAQMQKANTTALPSATMGALPAHPQPAGMPFDLPAPHHVIPFQSSPSAPSQASANFSIRLLNECQRLGLRCPLYKYFFNHASQLHQVQLKLAVTREPIFGPPAPTKLEATESAAQLGLEKLTATAPPTQFPAPPVQWRQPRNQCALRLSESEAQPAAQARMPESPKVAALSPPLHQKQQQFQQQMQQLQAQQQQTRQKTGPAEVRHAHPKQHDHTSRPPVPFIPLQAVKQQRIYRNSNSSEMVAKTNSHGRKNEEKRCEQQMRAGQAKAAESDNPDVRRSAARSESKGKPRRERKTRIAANFFLKP